MKQRLFILSQYLLPHHLLSRLIGCAAECRAAWFKDRLIGWFAKQYQVDMSEAQVEDLSAYEHFWTGRLDVLERLLRAEDAAFPHKKQDGE